MVRVEAMKKLRTASTSPLTKGNEEERGRVVCMVPTHFRQHVARVVHVLFFLDRYALATKLLQHPVPVLTKNKPGLSPSGLIHMRPHHSVIGLKKTILFYNNAFRSCSTILDPTTIGPTLSVIFCK